MDKAKFSSISQNRWRWGGAWSWLTPLFDFTFALATVTVFKVVFEVHKRYGVFYIVVLNFQVGIEWSHGE